MAERFRFRMPWLTSVTPHPAAGPEPPVPAADAPSAPSRPSVNIQVQRPPFRPAGIAPVQPSAPQSQAAKQAESRPTSASSATETNASTQSSEPLQAPTTEPASLPKSPPRAATESRVNTQPASLARSPSKFPKSDHGEKPRASPDVPSESLNQDKPAQASAGVQQRSTPQPLSLVPDSQPTSKETQQHPSSLVSSPSPPPPYDQGVKRQASPDTVQEVKEEVKDTRENYKVEEELTREGKTTGSIVEYKGKEPSADGKQSAAALKSISQAQIPPNVISRSEQKPKEKKDTRGRKRHSIGPDKEHITVREIQEDISKFVHKLGTGIPNQTGETSVSVVTLAGENKGASMHLGSEPSKKDGSIHIYRGYKSNPDESTGATTTDAEDNWQDNESKNPVTEEEPPIRPYVNSNAQGINNSMVIGSSITEGSPGVRMAFLFGPAEQAPASSDLPPPAAHKAQVNVTQAEKLTHESTVRRRCLRGLFLEPSDSDPDNPEKPRRHGCRYACGENTDYDIGIL